MLKLKKIVETIVVFIVVMLCICLCVSIYNVITGEIQISQVINKTGLYFLYTIGYGALEGDAIIQNILAIIGIVALALMSTYLTINLFWRLDDVKLNQKVLYSDGILKFEFQNNGRNICDMKASFMLYDELTLENIEEPKDYYMPILLKKSKWNLKVNLNDTFWYRVIYELLTDSHKTLYCMFSFVDTKNGQSSIKVEKITSRNLATTTGKLEYKEFTLPDKLNCQDLLGVENGGNIELNYAENLMNIEYKFKNNSKNDEFVMAYYDFHNDLLNLEKYNKEKTYLEFYAESAKKLDMNLEIKSPNGTINTQFLMLTEEPKIIQISLENINGNLENVSEICFTIFANKNKLNNNLKIGDLRIITK